MKIKQSLKETVSVTVIIPCFNCEKTLSRAMDSVLQQTVLPEQVILIDDASNDDTGKVMRQLHERYGPVWLKLVLLEKNHGPSHARNEGIKLAMSDYIAFLDADDSWHPEKLEIQFRWMKLHPDVVLTGHRIMLESSNKLNNQVTTVVTATKISKTQALLSNPFSTPTVMMRSDLPYRFETGQHYAEDYLFWLRVCLNDEKVYRLELTLAAMHKAAYGQSGLSRNLLAMENGEIETYQKIYKSKSINFFQYYGLVLFSFIKFSRRVVLSVIKKRTS